MIKNEKEQRFEGLMPASGSDRLSKAFYFVSGGAVGALVALLVAPKSGSDLRGEISDIARNGNRETKDLTNQILAESAEVFDTVKEKGGKMSALISDRWSHLGNKDGADSEELVNGQTGPLKDAARASRPKSAPTP